jgi:kynurenine formamidase
MHVDHISVRSAVRRIPILLAALPLTLAAAACGPAPEESSRDETATRGAAAPAEVARAIFTMETAEWVDMSHPFDDRTLYWPTAEAFRLDTVSVGETEGGWFYSAFRFSAAEHGGTHLDAPYHFAPEGAPVDEIPLGRLVGLAVVVDVSASVEGDPDYRVGVDDLEAWEAEHGRIPDGAILLLDTGWAERWPDREAYLGTAASGPEAVPELHFPGLHPDAARWLVEGRDVAAVGLDTPSIDYGQSSEFMSHRILYEAGIPGLENVARIDRLPPTGAYVMALPMKIGGGSGAPVRIVGVVPRAAD